jgi:hypothetical protein
MVVQAQHFVGFCHHQMQVVEPSARRNQAPAQLVDQIVKRNLTIHVHTLSRFIQHQQLRAAQQRAGQKTRCVSPPESFASAHRSDARLHAFQRRENIGFTGAGRRRRKRLTVSGSVASRCNFCGT